MSKIYIKTFGCALNQSDSEVMAGLLKKAGFEIAKNIDDARIVIINTCTVKQPSETKFFNYLEKINSSGKKIIIAGCIPQTDPEKLAGYSLIGVNQIKNIVEIVEETLNDSVVSLLVKERNQRLNLPKARKNKIIEIIPICEGCLGEPCAYCKVKSARGELFSYPIEEIKKQIETALKEGVKEIWLTAQDTGCYGKDIGLNLPALLNELLKIPGDYKIRLGMLNPNHVLEFLDELINVFKSDKIFKFMHIPFQAGSDEVLKRMRRKYTAKQFIEIVKKFRQEIPNITIATDVICGFPEETIEDFYKSIDIVSEIKPDVLNISRFWPRPKTEAEKMDGQLNGNETKRRSEIMAGIFNNIARMQNERWIDWEGEIIVDEKGKNNSFAGRNFAYKPVVVSQNARIGDKLKVKIEKITTFDLRGRILKYL